MLLNDLDEYLKLEPNSPIDNKIKELRDMAEQAFLESRNNSDVVQVQP
jgi:hypothetical protein